MALYVIRPPNPAAGHDWSAVVPGQWLYNITGITATLTTTNPGPQLLDSSGNGNLGNYVPAGGYEQFVAGLVAGNDAMQLGPTAGPWPGAYAQIAHTLIDWSADFSVELWWYFAAANAFVNELVVVEETQNATFAYLLTDQAAGGRLIWSQVVGGVQVNSQSNGGVVPYTNVAHHVVVRRTAGVISMCVDGLPVGMAAAPVLPAFPASVPLVFVGNDRSHAVGGTSTYDEIAVYPFALSNARVAAHYAAAGVSFAAYSAAILADVPSAYYHCDNVASSTGRQVCLEATDGDVPVALVPTGFVELATGGPWLYSWQPGVQSSAEVPAAGTFTVSIPDLILPAGYTVGTRTLDLQPGDRWSDIAIWWNSDVMDALTPPNPYEYPPGAHLVYQQRTGAS